jgi:hypothetical protein
MSTYSRSWNWRGILGGFNWAASAAALSLALFIVSPDHAFGQRVGGGGGGQGGGGGRTGGGGGGGVRVGGGGGGQGNVRVGGGGGQAGVRAGGAGGAQVRTPVATGGAQVRVPATTGGATVRSGQTTGGAAIRSGQTTGGANINAPGVTGGARVNVPQVEGQARTRATTGASGAIGANTGAAAGVNTGAAGINAGTAAGGTARTALRVPTTDTNIGANANTAAAANFRAKWANPRVRADGVKTNLSSAVKAAAPAAAATAAGVGAGVAADTATDAAASATGNFGANTPAANAGANIGANAAANTGANIGANTAANVGARGGARFYNPLNPMRANYWSNLGGALTNTALFGTPYGPYTGFGPYAYGYAGVPYFGGNFWSGRNLVGLGVASALGVNTGGYGYNWWGYSPWLGYRPYGYWYGNPGWGMFANYYGQPFFYDYGPNGNVVYQGNQVLVNDQPVGTPEGYAQSAAELASVTPEEMNAEHEWTPLGTFAVATSAEDKNPVRVAQLAFDNKQSLISGTIFNKQSGNLYTIQGKVDPQTQRVAFTIGNDPNVVMETGLYNLTQQATPVLVHFGGSKTQTYIFARLPEPKEGEQDQATTTATAPGNPAAPPANDRRE